MCWWIQLVSASVSPLHVFQMLYLYLQLKMNPKLVIHFKYSLRSETFLTWPLGRYAPALPIGPVQYSIYIHLVYFLVKFHNYLDKQIYLLHIIWPLTALSSVQLLSPYYSAHCTGTQGLTSLT